MGNNLHKISCSCEPCPPGTYVEAGVLTPKSACVAEPGGYSDGTTAGTCPAGTWTFAGATTKAHCTENVPAGSYNDGTTAAACPAECSSPPGATTSAQCTVSSGASKGR